MNQEESEKLQESESEEPSEPTEASEEMLKVTRRTYKCKYCGAEFDNVPDLGLHSKSCEARLQALGEKETEEAELAGGGAPSPSETAMSPREYVAFYGEEGLQKLKRQRLVEFLNLAPGVGKRTVAWIMKQYDLDTSARRDPNALMSLLQSGGIKDHISYRIVNALIALEEEYADLLKRQTPYPYPYRREEPTYPPFPSPYPQATTRIEPFPRYPQTQYPYAQYPPYPTDYYGPPSYSPVRIEEAVRRAVEEEFKKRESQQAQAQPQQVVTVTEPLRDAEGKLVYDRDGNPVYRKIVGPLNQVGVVSQEDPELRFMRKMKEWRELTKPERAELSEDKIRSIIREETAKKGEPITKEDIARASEEAAARVLAQKEAEDREEERFRRLEQAIRESATAKTVEGYHADEYRLLGQGMQTLATREPKTVKIIVEGVKDILYGPAPTKKEVEPGASEGIFEKLSQKYVAEE